MELLITKFNDPPVTFLPVLLSDQHNVFSDVQYLTAEASHKSERKLKGRR
jgi:hypothetical protein